MVSKSGKIGFINHKLEQLQHEFWFGCSLPNGIFNGNAGKEESRKFKKMFLENFNSAVTENALKWGQMEPQKGEVRFSLVDNMLTWCEENNIPCLTAQARQASNTVEKY